MGVQFSTVRFADHLYVVAPFELLKITAESNTLFESALAPGPGGLA